MNTKSDAIWINNNNRRSCDSSSNNRSNAAKLNLFDIQRSISIPSDDSSFNNTPYGSYSDPFESSNIYSNNTKRKSFNDDDFCSVSLSKSTPSSNGNNWKNINSMSQNRGRNLTRIEEQGKMLGFGDTIKKSIDKLFQPPKMVTQERNAVKDQVISMLCESALR